MAKAGVLDRIIPAADLDALDRTVAVQRGLGEPADAGYGWRR